MYKVGCGGCYWKLLDTHFRHRLPTPCLFSARCTSSLGCLYLPPWPLSTNHFICAKIQFTCQHSIYAPIFNLLQLGRRIGGGNPNQSNVWSKLAWESRLGLYHRIWKVVVKTNNLGLSFRLPLQFCPIWVPDISVPVNRLPLRHHTYRVMSTQNEGDDVRKPKGRVQKCQQQRP